MLGAPALCHAQSNLIIYSDSLAAGWQNWSYTSTQNFANTSPVHSGGDSISVTITGAYGGLQLGHSDMTNSAYSSITFWLNGGTNGGQQLQMYGNLDVGGTITSQGARYALNTPAAGVWQQYIVPLAALGVANATNFAGFAIQDDVGSPEPTFYIDDIQLASSAPPASVHLSVNAAQSIRTADARWFGMNVAVWDSVFDSPQTVTQLTNMGARALRFPGGSDSDDYHWVSNRQDANTWTWNTSVASFIDVITNMNGQAMTTVNYGSGFTNEAAAWVAYANASSGNSQSLGLDPNGHSWLTATYWANLRAAAPLATDDGRNFLRISRTAPLGFKYWEIGNEEYGSWETDSNSLPHDPYTYALRARDYISLMKAVDPTIKIGVVVTPGEDSYANYTNHPAFNARTGQTHFGWTPVLLATLKSLSVTPDFVIHHRYPQSPGGETDEGLLLSTSGWATDAANLRQMISDYSGSTGTNIEIICTENNSVSSNPGKQSTSLVNGLFFADGLAQLMQTEINGLFWWNFRNGGDSFGGNTNASLYGWRMYGDYGVTEGTDYYPPYYTARLMQDFVQPGDTVISATSDYVLLPAYAVRRQDGSMTILAINKDPSNTITGHLALSGFSPASAGTIYSYGIPQDNAAEFGTGSPDVAQINLSGAGTNFSYAFPPYSATVLALSPGPASLLAIPPLPTASQFVFQLQGQIGVPYVVQRSPDLVNWTSVNTNKLLSNAINITNSLAPSTPKQFWRAIWQP
ncbi:MAG TPA: alpha-L-arabinofuranosidase [Verrucomicrobiae bacterium]|nr:alpha-L-arabinofuranosidase [Verrucomicrobiae bacterium]